MPNDVAGRPSARERILERSASLFYAEGIHAVGVDRVATESGVTKATLYQQFRSKDELVAAYLNRRSEQWRHAVSDVVLAQAGSPVQRVSAVFALLAKGVAAPGFRGCPFINAAAEYPGPGGPVATVIADHRAAVRGLFAEVLAACPSGRRNDLTDQLVLLYDGAMVGAQLDGGARAARRAQHAARRLLDTAPPPP